VGRFLLRRTGAAVVVLLLTTLLVFAGLRAVPDNGTALGAGYVDPATGVVDPTDPKVKQAIEHKYLLNRPLPVQYGHWLWLALQGDLGRDKYAAPVGRTIMQKLPVTLELALFAVLIAIVVGIPAGVIAAVRRGKATDHATTTVAIVGMSIPTYWLGLLFITWFAVDLRWLPVGGYASIRHPLSNLEHMAMPAIVLSVGIAAHLMRQMRTSMLDSLGSDYIRTARAKGLTEWTVVGRHALRNSLITVTTIVGLTLGHLIVGAVLLERIFNIPGFGSLTVNAVSGRDYPLIQGTVLVAALGFIVASLGVDIAYSALNPRIRLS
jgi:peptide/nickel transport system permease protein